MGEIKTVTRGPTITGSERARNFAKDKNHDPTGERTRWIVGQLLRGGKTGGQIRELCVDNGLGYKPMTYSRDLVCLKNRGFVYSDRGTYYLDTFGRQWAEYHGIK
jgi:hypothetical protein